MKKLLAVFIFVCLASSAFGQNLTTVSGSNITDINGSKLAAGQICFLITDQSDNPISVSIGGGGQALKRGYCSAVTAGVITGFTVPNPSATSPSGIYYRITVKDSSTGQEVLRYTLVSFTGATFNFDNYAPTNLAQGAPLSGTTVSGNLSGNGNATFTGTVTGSNIPSSILQQIFSSGVGQTQRTAFNVMAGLTCSDNAGTSRTDCRLGTLTTVTFSATPTFDASTASTFKLTLTGNVTSSTLSNAVAGQPINIEVCQDGTGGRTFVPPTNVQGWVTIPSGASACIMQDLVYDGTNAVASSAGTVEFSSPPPIGNTTPNTVAATALTATSLNLNSAATGRNAVITAGGTSSSTGGISIFVGPSGGQNERLAVDPADGSTAALRAGAISIRSLSAGFLNGAEVGKIDTSGNLILGTTPAASGIIRLPSNTSIAWRNNANSGDILFTKNASDQFTLGNVTVPNVTDTLVGKATTDIFTNKTVSDTLFIKRLRATQGTALVAGDFAISAGWGNTASVGSVLGTDAAFSAVITSAGTGQAAGPTVTLTFHDGTWTNSPICTPAMGPGNNVLAAWLIQSVSATALVLQATLVSGNFTPAATNTVGLTVSCVGR